MLIFQHTFQDAELPTRIFTVGGNPDACKIAFNIFIPLGESQISHCFTYYSGLAMKFKYKVTSEKLTNFQLERSY